MTPDKSREYLPDDTGFSISHRRMVASSLGRESSSPLPPPTRSSNPKRTTREKHEGRGGGEARRSDSCGKTVMAISHVRPKGGIYDRPRQNARGEAGCESARERGRERSGEPRYDPINVFLGTFLFLSLRLGSISARFRASFDSPLGYSMPPPFPPSLVLSFPRGGIVKFSIYHVDGRKYI